MVSGLTQVTGITATTGGGGGDVTGPGSSTAGNIATFSGTSGKIIQDSGIAATSVLQVGKQTLWIPATGMTPATTSGAAPGQYEAASGVNVEVLDFDSTADEYACFNIAMPKSWNEGTVTFQVWWTSTATDTDGVAWGLQGVAISDNEALNTAFGTDVIVTDDLQGAAAELYVSSESSAVTIAGTPAAGDLCCFRIFRDVSDPNDDATEDARLIGIKLLYTVDAANDA